MNEDNHRLRPRKRSKSPNPVAQVRLAVGLTQSQYAQQLDVSLATIKAVERTDMTCSHSLASKIQFIFGVNRDSLLKGPKALSAFQSGEEYSKECHLVWQQLCAMTDKQAEAIATRAATRVYLLILAANRKHKVFAVSATLEETMLKTIKSTGLLPSMVAVAKERGGDPLIPSLDELNEPTFRDLTEVVSSRLYEIRNDLPLPPINPLAVKSQTMPEPPASL